VTTLKRGDYVRMSAALKADLRQHGRADHVEEYGDCVGVITEFGRTLANGKEGVSVRWNPSCDYYGYDPDLLEPNTFELGDFVRMSPELKAAFRRNDSAAHVKEFGRCVGVVSLIYHFEGTSDTDVDVRWQPSNLRYGYASRFLLPAARPPITFRPCPGHTVEGTVVFRARNLKMIRGAYTVEVRRSEEHGWVWMVSKGKACTPPQGAATRARGKRAALRWLQMWREGTY
jgi:hypothetical protein